MIVGIKGLPNAYKLLGRKVPHWAERGAHGCSMLLLATPWAIELQF